MLLSLGDMSCAAWGWWCFLLHATPLQPAGATLILLCCSLPACGPWTFTLLLRTSPTALLPEPCQFESLLLHPPQSLDFYMIAVHLTPKDLSLWKRLAQLSTQQGLVRQAIYCYTQVGRL